MKIKEKIQIIVKEQRGKDDYSLGIDFMHSFGLKCDCVGWATIILDSEEKLELVKRMGEEARKQKINIRCSYEKEVTGADAEWYFIKPSYHLNNDWYDYDELSTLDAIKGYKIPKGMNLISIGGDVAVSEKFRNFCREEDFSGISFVWVNDTGRYKAEPFFYAYSNVEVSNPTTGGKVFNRDSNFTRKLKVPYCQQADEIGGNLTVLNEIFCSLEFTEVPIMVSRDNMPESDFAVVSNDGLSERLLVRSTAADKLLEKGLVKKKDLRPVIYYAKEKHKLLITHNKPEKFLGEKEIELMEKEYQKFLEKKKPEYVPTEKATLALLRKAKREDKDRFEKAIKKSIIQTLESTRFAAIAPYYAITNGGELSDEVAFYGYEEVEGMTNEFLTELNKGETILEEFPQLINPLVIGGTANGDSILLLTNGKIMRYNHEDPTLSQEWNTVFEFFYDNLEM